MDRRLDSLRSSNLCDEAAHLCLSSWVHSKGLPQLGVLYARGNRFAASARAPQGVWSKAPDAARTLGDSLREESVGMGPRLQDRGLKATVCRQEVSPRVHAGGSVDFRRQFPSQSVAPRPHRTSRRPMKKAPPKRGLARREEPASSYWMRVRQYGHTFQSALSGRWQVGQTFLTCVLQIGQTTKSRSMGAPHLGQMP